jgi:hypothetical protein
MLSYISRDIGAVDFQSVCAVIINKHHVTIVLTNVQKQMLVKPAQYILALVMMYVRHVHHIFGAMLIVITNLMDKEKP